MSDNQAFLQTARDAAAQFRARKDPDALTRVVEALENVQWREPLHLPERRRLRHAALDGWLHLVALVDDALDPNFDPAQVPQIGVQPPPTASGIVYPPGVDPALIDDPDSRARYAQAVADNTAYAEQYRLQSRLQRLQERILEACSAFIQDGYSGDPNDHGEASTAIQAAIKTPKRRAELLSLLSAAP